MWDDLTFIFVVVRPGQLFPQKIHKISKCEHLPLYRVSFFKGTLHSISPAFAWVPTRDMTTRRTNHEPRDHNVANGMTPPAPLHAFDRPWSDEPELTNFRLSHRSPQAVDRTRQEQKSQDPGATGSTGKPLCTAHSLLPPQLHLLLLEVSPVLLVDEHQIEEVFDRELIVDVLERWCQVFEPACVQTHTSVGARGRA